MLGTATSCSKHAAYSWQCVPIFSISSTSHFQIRGTMTMNANVVRIDVPRLPPVEVFRREGLSLTTVCSEDSETETYIPTFLAFISTLRTSDGILAVPQTHREPGTAHIGWRTPTKPRVSNSPILASALYIAMRCRSVSCIPGSSLSPRKQKRPPQERALLTAAYR